jgi:hypothetical protein
MMTIWTLKRWGRVANYVVVYAFEAVVGRYF